MNFRPDSGQTSDYMRSGTRFEVDHACVIHHGGAKYSCTLKNISLTGVLVSAPGNFIDAVRMGDICGISFSSNPSARSAICSGTVARREQLLIALNLKWFIY
jgi:hypothetical protein